MWNVKDKNLIKLKDWDKIELYKWWTAELVLNNNSKKISYDFVFKKPKEDGSFCIRTMPFYDIKEIYMKNWWLFGDKIHLTTNTIFIFKFKDNTEKKYKIADNEYKDPWIMDIDAPILYREYMIPALFQDNYLYRYFSWKSIKKIKNIINKVIMWFKIPSIAEDKRMILLKEAMMSKYVGYSSQIYKRQEECTKRLKWKTEEQIQTIIITLIEIHLMYIIFDNLPIAPFDEKDNIIDYAKNIWIEKYHSRGSKLSSFEKELGSSY